MRIHFRRMLAIALVLMMVCLNLPASALIVRRINSFTLSNMADASIVEVYIYPTNGGRGVPRNHSWIHPGDSTVINFSDSDLNSRASWTMGIGFRTNRGGINTITWSNITPLQLVNASYVTVTTNLYGDYILDYSAPTTNNDYTAPLPPSILECIEKGRLQVDASSWFRGNNPSVHPSKMMDGDVYSSWDSDDESHPDFWFTTTDGNEYTVKGFRILNGKFDEYYFYRNGRVARLEMYVDGQFIKEIFINDERGVYQTVWFDEPVYGSEFFFHVSYIYRGNHETREDLCISEFEFF